MRTTIDIPDEIMRQAKIAAVERGVTLRELVGSALRRDLARPAGAPTPTRRRLRFPIFPSRRPGALQAKDGNLSRVELEEEARRNGLAP